MRRKPVPGSIAARVLNELFTGPLGGLSASELSVRLGERVQTCRTAANRLVHWGILGFRRRQTNNSEDRVKFMLSQYGRAFIAGVDPIAEARHEPLAACEDDTHQLSAPPDIAHVKRFVPSSVWALGDMTRGVAG